ncbi:hypothetical protein VNO78_15199 [Psophocarpus tetragonolobus]|uniref:Uncharacterized protein n=1 Tax=Psophocarpus tetragonolobus TaxID=3891 RepID=A0AAN9XJJ7_PSOTE
MLMSFVLFSIRRTMHKNPPTIVTVQIPLKSIEQRVILAWAQCREGGWGILDCVGREMLTEYISLFHQLRSDCSPFTSVTSSCMLFLPFPESPFQKYENGVHGNIREVLEEEPV